MKTPKKTTTLNPGRIPGITCLTFAAMLVAPLLTARAADINWQGPTADYTNALDWAGGVVPGSGDNAINDNTSNNVVQISLGNPNWTVNDIRAGNATNDGAWVQNGQTLTLNGWFRLGLVAPYTGIYTLNSGTINYQGNHFTLGEFGTGIVNMNGGAINGSGNFAINLGGINDGNVNPLNANVCVFNQTNGAVNITGGGQLFVGNQGTGVYNLSGGSMDVHNYIAIGRSGGTGTLNMTGGTLNQDGGGNLLVGTAFQNNGHTCVGVVNQSGGTVTSQGQLLIPENAPSTGTYNLSGTGAVIVNNWLAVGRNGASGVLNMTNGSVTKTGNGSSHFDVGAGGPGVINQYGGAITNTTSDFYLGESAAGTWNFNGGTAILGNVIMCVNASASGVLNLNGGLFQATGIASPTPAAVSILNLNGATLQANANNANFISGLYQATVGPGSVIDSQGFNITVPEALADNAGGSLTKNGTGTLTLTGANTYAGATVVNAGTLITGTASTAGGGYTIADNAGFGVLVQAANAQYNAASVALGVTSGVALNFNLGSFGNPTSAPLNITTLTANGTITVNVAASVIATGTIPLMHYVTLAGSPTYVLGSLPAGVVASLTTVSNTLELVVTSAGAPRWDGNVTGAWDLGTNQDWYDLGTLALTVYTDGKPVIFDDNAAGTTTVNLTATVAPASINFNNNTKPYSIVGPGVISGNIGLNLNGATNVSILNTGGNTFTGPVVVNAGILNVTNLANGGSPSPLGASSSSPTNLVINGATFEYSGSPVTANRGFAIGATNTTIDAEGNLTLGGNVTAATNTLGGGSALTKIGPAQLGLTGAGNNEFSRGYTPGVRIVAGTLLLDGSAGSQTNHTPSEMWIGCTTNSGAALILTNTTLHVDSWVGLGRINGGINNTSSITLYNSAMTVGNLSLGWDGNLPNNLSTQFLTLNGNSSLTNFGSVNLAEGVNSSMTMNIKDNSIFWVQNPFYIGLVNNTTGSVVVANSGSIVSANGWFDIANGNNSVGSVLVKDNGSISTVGDFNLTDSGTGATASFTIQDNATLHANNLWVGKATGVTANFTITNNATVVSANGLTMSTHFDGTPEVTSSTFNLAGGSLAVNLAQGNIVAGVYYGTFNFNGGKLIAHGPYFGPNLMYNLAAINVQAGGAFIEIDNTDATAIAQPLLGGNGDGGLTKLGTGTFYLNAVNTYTNTTVVSNGTLGGTGTIAGPVMVASGATLTAGAGAIGTLNVNRLTFAAGSTSLMKVTPASNDQIAGLAGVTYGGALVVTNTSASPLVVGHTYTLFNSAAPGSGNFSSVTILPSGSGTFNPTNGVLTITSVGGGLTFNPVKIAGGNLILTGMGGAANAGYTLLTSTNLTTPIAFWTTNTTGTLDGTGAFSNAIPVSASQPAQFFRIRTP